MGDKPVRRFDAPPRAADVYARASEASTLGAVEHALGYTTHGVSELEEDWLTAVRARALHDLSDEDLAALLSRGLHLPLTLPLALRRLREAAAEVKPPLPELVRACGAAAPFARRGAPILADETAAVLRQLLGVSWTDGRLAVIEAVYAALEADQKGP